MNRPTGITVLGVLAVIYGIFNLLLTLLALLGSAMLASRFAASSIRFSAGTLAYAAISDAVIGIAFLAFGIGALRLVGWGWTAGVGALVLDIARQLLGLLIQGFGIAAIVRGGITIVILLIVLWYLFRPTVRGAFRTAASPPESAARA